MVWAIVLSVPKAMREPENEIRQYVPTPFYFITAYRREQVRRISQRNMKAKDWFILIFALICLLFLICFLGAAIIKNLPLIIIGIIVIAIIYYIISSL